MHGEEATRSELISACRDVNDIIRPENNKGERVYLPVMPNTKRKKLEQALLSIAFLLKDDDALYEQTFRAVRQTLHKHHKRVPFDRGRNDVPTEKQLYAEYTKTNKSKLIKETVKTLRMHRNEQFYRKDIIREIKSKCPDISEVTVDCAVAHIIELLLYLDYLRKHGNKVIITDISWLEGRKRRL